MPLSRGLKDCVGTSCKSESVPGQLPAGQNGWGKGNVRKNGGSGTCREAESMSSRSLHQENWLWL